MKNLLVGTLLLLVATIGHAFTTVAPLAVPQSQVAFRCDSPLYGASVNNFRNVQLSQLVPANAKEKSQELVQKLRLQWSRIMTFMMTEHRVHQVTIGWKKKIAAFALGLSLMWTMVPAQPTSSNTWWGGSTKSRLAQRKTYNLGGKSKSRRVVVGKRRQNRPLLFQTSKRNNRKQISSIASAARTLGSLMVVSAVVGTLQRDRIKDLINGRTQVPNLPAAAVAAVAAVSDSIQHTPTTMSALGAGQTLLQISVALHVRDRDDWNSIITVLERKTKAAKFDRRISHALLTSQIAMELARRRSSIIAADSKYRHYRNANTAQEDFQKQAAFERQNYDTQGLHDTDSSNVQYHDTKGLKGETVMGSLSMPSQIRQTTAVVTMIAAIDGDATQIPEFNTPTDVTRALQLLATHAKVEDCLRNVEILWTPHSSQESLQPRDLAEVYPNLRTF